MHPAKVQAGMKFVTASPGKKAIISSLDKTIGSKKIEGDSKKLRKSCK